MDYGANTVRNLVHGLNGPRVLAARLREMTSKDLPSEDAISKWNERNRIPFIYRRRVKTIARENGYKLSDAEKAALDTGD